MLSLDRLKLATTPYILLMVVAAQFELSGCYAFWKWIHDHRPAWWAVVGAFAFMIYGTVQAIQPSNFGRAYAAYGGVFICSALVWAWQHGDQLDRGDTIGAAFCIVGACIIKFWPGH